MNAENFCYWLQGFVEIHGGLPDEGQWYMIKEHLQHVFDKQTKSKEQVKELLEKAKKDPRDFEVVPPTFMPTNPYPSYWQYPHRPSYPFQPIITCQSLSEHTIC